MSEITLIGRRALIGRGFIGQTLDKPGRFTNWYNSENIYEMSGHYDLVICAAPSAVKWRANESPDIDYQSICDLINAFTKVNENSRVVLISTIDAGLRKDAYGKNRRILEEYIMNAFKDSLVVRLPAVFGKGLKKNILFDLLNGYVDHVNGSDTYQWWNVEHLWNDLQFHKRSTGLRTFYSDPVPIWELIWKCFPDFEPNSWEHEPQVSYNSFSNLHMSKEEIIIEMKIFVDQWRKEHEPINNHSDYRPTDTD